MSISVFKRLTFHTTQMTDISCLELLVRIEQKLKESKYIIDDVTKDSVSFGREPFELVWRHQAPYILDGGVFKIEETENGATVTLCYFIKTLWPFLLFFAMVVFFLVQRNYWPILFFGGFFLIASVFQYFTTKSVGEQLLSDILEVDKKLIDKD